MKLGEPLVSVLIGRVSTIEPGRIIEVLQALRAQDLAAAHEVIVVDRRQDEWTERMAREFPEVRLLPCDAGLPLPAMRNLALEAAAGEFVVVTEDHCVPGPTWLRTVSDVFREHPSATAIAGAVENGSTASAVDAATYLCEYAEFTPPIVDGPSERLCGVNIAYRRAALLQVPVELRRGAFWETAVDPYLRRSGATLLATNRLRVEHRKRIPLRSFLAHRFAYSRQFAGSRFPPRSWLRRAVAATLAPALPIVLVARMARSAARSPAVARALPAAAPFLLVFFVAWALGELVGYSCGPGSALAEVE